MSEKVHYLTSDGRRKLEKELEYLETVKRKEVARNLQSAIEEGDLRENAGYAESKRQQGLVEGRILDIRAILKNAEVLDEDQQSETIQVGSCVTVAEKGRDSETYQIVGAPEADPVEGRISNESPLGAALIGHRPGDAIEVNTPGGTITFKILALE